MFDWVGDALGKTTWRKCNNCARANTKFCCACFRTNYGWRHLGVRNLSILSGDSRTIVNVLTCLHCDRAVDGVAVQDWGLEEIKSLTVGLEGTHVTVDLRRGPHAYNLTLIRIHPEKHSMN